MRQVLVGLTGLLVGLLLAEMSVRVVAPQAIGVALPMYEPDSLCVHRLRPGFSGTLRSGEYATRVRINPQGFRGAPWEHRPRRVLVVGDSFTFGYGVEEGEAYPAVVERVLASRGCSTAVYNAGVPGYGTLQEEWVVRRWVPVLRPQVVVLGFTVGSDLRDNLEQLFRPHEGYEVRDGYLVKRGTPTGPKLAWKAWFQSHSHLYVLVQKARVRAALRKAKAPELYSPCEHFLADPPCGQTSRTFLATCDALGRLAEVCRQEGASCVVVLIPHPLELDDHRWEKEKGRGGLSRYAASTRIEECCRSLGVECVNLLPALRVKPLSRVFFRLDGHLTREGHQRVATHLVPLLEALLCTGSVDSEG